MVKVVRLGAPPPTWGVTAGGAADPARAGGGADPGPVRLRRLTADDPAAPALDRPRGSEPRDRDRLRLRRRRDRRRRLALRPVERTVRVPPVCRHGRRSLRRRDPGRRPGAEPGADGGRRRHVRVLLRMHQPRPLGADRPAHPTRGASPRLRRVRVRYRTRLLQRSPPGRRRGRGRQPAGCDADDGRRGAAPCPCSGSRRATRAGRTGSGSGRPPAILSRTAQRRSPDAAEGVLRAPGAGSVGACGGAAGGPGFRGPGGRPG